MNRAEILNILKELTCSVLNNDNVVVEETSDFMEELGMTSLQVVTLLTEIEDRFAVEFEEEDIFSFTDVASVIDFLLDQQ